MRLTTKIIRVKVLEMTPDEARSLREAIERAERGESDPPIAPYAIRLADDETFTRERNERMAQRDEQAMNRYNRNGKITCANDLARND